MGCLTLSGNENRNNQILLSLIYSCNICFSYGKIRLDEYFAKRDAFLALPIPE